MVANVDLHFPKQTFCCQALPKHIRCDMRHEHQADLHTCIDTY